MRRDDVSRNKPFFIREVMPADIPVLLEMIRELAAFEKLEGELETTEESLRSALFGTRPAASALVASVDGTIAGYAVYFLTFSTFVGRPGLYLEDLYVRPQYRRRGLGKALLARVAWTGAPDRCGRYEWAALNWNRKALRFYEGLGARPLVDWVLMRMNGEPLRRLMEGR